MAAEIDIEEVKDAIGLKLVTLLSGPNSERFLSPLPEDERRMTVGRRQDILINMARPRAGVDHSGDDQDGMERRDAWVMTLDMAFQHSLEFSQPLFKALCSYQDAEVAEAASTMVRDRRLLNEDILEGGTNEQLVFDDEKELRLYLERRLELSNAVLEYECHVREILSKIVSALNQLEYSGSSDHSLWDL